jgi:hypothetical protein
MKLLSFNEPSLPGTFPGFLVPTELRVPLRTVPMPHVTHTCRQRAPAMLMVQPAFATGYKSRWRPGFCTLWVTRLGTGSTLGPVWNSAHTWCQQMGRYQEEQKEGGSGEALWPLSVLTVGRSEMAALGEELIPKLALGKGWISSGKPIPNGLRGNSSSQQWDQCN